MEILFLGWLILAGAGLYSAHQDKPSEFQANRETRIIQQTRETIYTQQILKEWAP
jgi:hypothetical protein